MKTSRSEAAAARNQARPVEDERGRSGTTRGAAPSRFARISARRPERGRTAGADAASAVEAARRSARISSQRPQPSARCASNARASSPSRAPSACKRRQLFERLVMRHLFPQGDTGEFAREVSSIPRRTRVFTVPRGVCVRSAISCCVRPSKYASSRARRWSCGQLADRGAADRLPLPARDARLQVVLRGGLRGVGRASWCATARPSGARGARSIARLRAATSSHASTLPARRVEGRGRAPDVEENVLEHLFGLARVARGCGWRGR